MTHHLLYATPNIKDGGNQSSARHESERPNATEMKPIIASVHWSAQLALILIVCMISTRSGLAQQKLDAATCRLLCVSCEKSRQVYAQHCAARNATGAATAGSDADCPCLQLPSNSFLLSARAPDLATITSKGNNCSVTHGTCSHGHGHVTNSSGCPTGVCGMPPPLAPIDCPEPQPPPPPPGCPPGGFVRCELGGPGGRCYGNCTCLTTNPVTRQPKSLPPAVGDCPTDPCPPSNCLAYAPTSPTLPPGCQLCSDCSVNPWWCFAERHIDCGNVADVCGAGRKFRRDRDGCQVDCSCVDVSAGGGSDSDEHSRFLPTSAAAMTSCRLSEQATASCRRACRKRHGGDGRLQVDETGCELCQCCGACEGGDKRSGHRRCQCH